MTGRYESKEEDAGKTVVVRGGMKVDENDLGVEQAEEGLASE